MKRTEELTFAISSGDIFKMFIEIFFVNLKNSW